MATIFDSLTGNVIVISRQGQRKAVTISSTKSCFFQRKVKREEERGEVEDCVEAERKKQNM